MSEATTPPEPPADPPPPEPPAPERRPRDNRPLWVAGAGLLLLAVALFLVWRSLSDRIDASAGQFAALEDRVAALEQRPLPPNQDLGPLAARVSTLEQRPATQSQAPAAPRGVPAPDLAPIEGRLTAIEQRQPQSLAPLENRLAALEAKQGADAQLATRVAALESADRSIQAELSRRLDADEARLSAGEKRASRNTQVQAVALALAAGQKLGDVSGAPPALARFANEPPPSEGALRLAFSSAAREALAVSHPAADGKPLMERLWLQAQELVTVRQGERVLLGDPTAGVLERARSALDAGDLATAVAAVGTLEGAPAQAMGTWLAQARALLDARAALAAWAVSG